MTIDDGLRRLADADEPRFNPQSALRTMLRAGEDGVTELLLIRHAQMPRTTNPLADEGLTEVGRAQAEALAAFLARRPLHAVYASPTQRTRETAAPVARAHGLDVTIVDDLRDLDAFIPEGADWEAIRQSEAFQAMAARFVHERRFDVYGRLREPSNVVRQRVKAALDEIAERHPGRRIAIVTHGPVINAYVAGLVHSPYDMLGQTALTGITVVLAQDERRYLHAMNARPHLGAI